MALKSVESDITMNSRNGPAPWPWVIIVKYFSTSTPKHAHMPASEFCDGPEWDWQLSSTTSPRIVVQSATGVSPYSEKVAEKKRQDEAKNIQASWFPSVMKRVTPLSVAEKGDSEMPQCMIRLAAGLHKVIASGHMVTPPLFWSLVRGAFQKDDHREKLAHRMILACLSCVRQRPEDYHRFLTEDGIKVPRPVKALLAKLNKNRGHGNKKGALLRKATLTSHGGAGSNMNFLQKHGVGQADPPEGGAGYWGGNRENSIAGSHADLAAGGGGSRWGGMSVAGSEPSDNMSDTMSVLSYMSRETTAMAMPHSAVKGHSGGGMGGGGTERR